jgi:topoisomerase IA-like protein
VLGANPENSLEITLRSGRFGDYVQEGEAEKGSEEKPRRSSLPRGLSPDDVTLEKALALLSLPREVARHPTSNEPILAGIGRYGAYVQHGKTYANLGRDDDVLEVGANRAIDLIVAKESGAGAARFGGGGAGRVLGEHPEGGQVSVKQGRFGTYVNHGKNNATIPKGTDPTGLTLDDAVALLKARAAGGGVIGRLVGQHPDGGPVTVRDGRYGAYVNWGKVNATIPKGTTPDSITLGHALELIAEREGRPAAQPRKKAGASAKTNAGPRKSKAAPSSAKGRPPKPAVKSASARAGKPASAKKPPRARVRRPGKPSGFPAPPFRRVNRQSGKPARLSRSLSRLMTHGLDVVAVRIEDEGAVIVLVVVGPRTRRAIVAAARLHRGAVERIDLGARLRSEGDMRSALGLRASADPEERLSIGAETGARITACFLRRDFHHHAEAERLQRAQIEGFRPTDVANRNADVINHVKALRSGGAPGARKPASQSISENREDCPRSPRSGVVEARSRRLNSVL